MNNDSQLLEAIESTIASVLPSRAHANLLYIPIDYTLQRGGKRLRPLLCLKACEAAGANALDAINQAVAVEMFHNFTLIHDDVMDKSDTRRGRPTVFAKWGSTQAILSGDALLTLAIQKVAECDGKNLKKVLEVFNKTALEVYEGQQLDMDFETRDDVTTDEYLEMIRLKTSVLLGCACRIGAIIGNASENMCDALYKYGEMLGLAFQLRDDWLDTFGNVELFGKPIGGDIRNKKKTWLYITAQSESGFEMNEALKLNDDERVAKVTEIYASLDLSERCDTLIQRFCDEAISALKDTDLQPDSKIWFEKTAKSLCSRTK